MYWPSPSAVISRLIDGIGFRYNRATEGLREGDPAFRPPEEGLMPIAEGMALRDRKLFLAQDPRQTRPAGRRVPGSAVKIVEKIKKAWPGAA